MFSDPETMRYWSRPPFTRLEEAEELVTRARDSGEHGRSLVLGLDFEGSAIGTCVLHTIEHQCRRAEVGYRMGSDYWGRGLMSEALTALINFAFDELEFIRLEADTDPRNAASIKLLERMGFLQEGYLRRRWIVEDEVSDALFFGLLVEDWRLRHPA
jgi:RimJ/RimL family protein N-acetyltransferase